AQLVQQVVEGNRVQVPGDLQHDALPFHRTQATGRGDAAQGLAADVQRALTLRPCRVVFAQGLLQVGQRGTKLPVALGQLVDKLENPLRREAADLGGSSL